MVEAVYELAVDLVRHQQQVVFLDQAADDLYVLRRQHTARRVLWCVDDQHPRLGCDQRLELIEVEAETALLAQRHGLWNRADEIHLRRVRGITRVGQDHLVARLDTREEREQQHVLRARHQDHVRRIDLRLQTPRYEPGHGLPRLEYPARRRVMRVAVLHRADRGLDDVVRCPGIRLTNL